MTFEQRKNTKALSITVGIHALLFLFFFLFRYTMPAQMPIDEMGMDVNLGTSDDGFGDDQPEMMNDPAARALPIEAASSEEIEAITKDVHLSEQETDPAVAITKKNERRTPPNQARNTQTQATPTKQPQARYVYTNTDGEGGNKASQDKAGGNEGIGQGEGDMGVPGGRAGATNYQGTPGRGTMSYSLNNRTLVARPDPNATFKRGGKVTVSVTVARDGRIVGQRILSSDNPEIRRLTTEMLKDVRFNATNDARAEERGTITFHFR